MGDSTQWRRSQQSGGGRSYGNGQQQPWKGNGGAPPAPAAARGDGQGEKKPGRGYKDLIAWQKAMELLSLVHRLAQRLPPEERTIADQLCRAALSVPATIAAGQGRGDAAEFARALTVARGHLAEVDTLLEIAVALGHFRPAELAQVEDLMIGVRVITMKLIQRLRDGPKRDGPPRGSGQRD